MDEAYQNSQIPAYESTAELTVEPDPPNHWRLT